MTRGLNKQCTNGPQVSKKLLRTNLAILTGKTNDIIQVGIICLFNCLVANAIVLIAKSITKFQSFIFTYSDYLPPHSYTDVACKFQWKKIMSPELSKERNISWFFWGGGVLVPIFLKIFCLVTAAVSSHTWSSARFARCCTNTQSASISSSPCYQKWLWMPKHRWLWTEELTMRHQIKSQYSPDAPGKLTSRIRCYSYLWFESLILLMSNKYVSDLEPDSVTNVVTWVPFHPGHFNLHGIYAFHCIKLSALLKTLFLSQKANLPCSWYIFS